MNSLTTTYLDALAFSAEQASVMRALGEYRGKQRLYERQRPELLEALLTVAKIESTDASRGGPQSLDRLAANLRWYLLSIICCQIEQSSSSRS